MRAIVIPTRNEAVNVEHLLERLTAVCPPEPTQVMFVDDSDDGTAQAVGQWLRRRPIKLDVRVVHRPPGARQGGLGGAVLTGLRSVDAPWVCVMDGDLQHPPEAVPLLFARAEAGGTDLVIGTRHRRAGARAGLGRTRAAASRLATTLARRSYPARLGNVSDPLSGFFVLRRAVLDDRPELAVAGFKVLLAILLCGDPLAVAEVDYAFSPRRAGRSKASVQEAKAYLETLIGPQRQAA